MKRIEQKVIKFIEKHDLIQSGDSILVAFSGGPDSIFLLNFLVQFKRRFKIKKIAAFHLNHMIRGKEADLDEKFCKKFAAKAGVGFFSARKRVKSFAEKNKLSVEEAGRKLRYSELEKLSRKSGFNKIATAHIADDNTETVLLNLIKGAGLKGLAGIPVKRGNIIRPLLGLSKNEIINYLEKKNISYRTDATNFQTDYERNFIRKEIIPLIKDRLNPSLEETLLNSSDILRNYISLIEKDVGQLEVNVESQDKDSIKISLGELNKIDDRLLGDFFRKIIEKNFKADVTYNDINNLKTLLKKETGKKVDISNSLTVFKNRNNIFIFRKKLNSNFDTVRLKIGDSVQTDIGTLSINYSGHLPEKFSNKRNEEYISSDKLEKTFTLRRWKKGDKFIPLGFKGTKKISDFLNDCKIPSSSKKNQFVLVNKGEIVWVVGLRINDHFKISNKTKKAVKLCLIQ